MKIHANDAEHIIIKAVESHRVFPFKNRGVVKNRLTKGTVF